MYPWCSHTWNPIKGCEHDCHYCYVKRLSERYGYSLKPRLVEKELRTNLGKRNTIFVGSTSDMFGQVIPSDWIERVLHICNVYPQNLYFFQTKNPKRLQEFVGKFPLNSIFGTTIETNENYRKYLGGNAPLTWERAQAFAKFTGKKMVSIEPIMAFDLKEMVKLVSEIRPIFVSIGADSSYTGLHSEPTSDEIEALIDALWEITEVRLKTNIRRLLVTKESNSKKEGDKKK